MKKTKEELKQLIFDLMRGTLYLENNPPNESKYVENEYEEDKVCGRAYAEILEAYRHLCQKLECGEEDNDIETIITSFNTITECLCMKMFDYCCLFTQPSIK